MEITNDLIQKFFANKCDKEEAEAVIAYLSGNRGLIEKYLPVQEWNETRQDGILHEDSNAEMLRHISARLFRKERKSKGALVLTLKWYAVAASILLLLSGIRFIVQRYNLKQDSVATNGNKKKEKGEDKAISDWVTRSNNTNRSLNWNLPDGSLVRLYSHSSLRYKDSFAGKGREVWLDGKAYFSVVKKSEKPFTVISGNLATTALGTSFDVNAPGSGNQDIQVKLYSGRVVVKAVQGLPGWSKDIYLLPGDQVCYDKIRMTAAITHVGNQPPSTKGKNKEEGIFNSDNGKELTFANSSLQTVLEELSARYRKKIDYDAADISGINFTGTVSASDSLYTFLKLLAALNGLEVQEKDTIYKVTRSPVR